jgi:predicted transcriptional regulator of viral defense system
MSRSLSALESQLILHLEWEKQPVVTIEETMAILGVSYDQARQILSRLARRRWLAPIVPGKYELIPAERGEFAFSDTNPLFIGSVLVQPYYFSYSTAAFFHGLSTQAAATVYIATTTRREGLLVVRDKEYRLVLQPPHKFFGAMEVDAYGSRVQMAEPEKAILDSLDRPQYAGDIPEVAAMLWRGQGRLDWLRLAEYAQRFRSQSLVQRLGRLADLLSLPMSDEARTHLLDRVGKNTCYLGQPGRWGRGGEYNATWQVVDNVPRRELLGDIEVR